MSKPMRKEEMAKRRTVTTRCGRKKDEVLFGAGEGEGKPKARRDAPGVKALIKRIRILRASACSAVGSAKR